GGVLFDHGVHIFYQLREALGAADTVQATVRTLRHEYGVEDSAFVVLEYERAVAHMRLTWAARRRCIRFRFVGEAGEILGDDETMTLEAERKETLAFGHGLS